MSERRVSDVVAALLRAGRERLRRATAAEIHRHDQGTAALRACLEEAGVDLDCPHVLRAALVGAMVSTGALLRALGMGSARGEERRGEVLAALAAALAEICREGGR